MIDTIITIIIDSNENNKINTTNLKNIINNIPTKIYNEYHIFTNKKQFIEHYPYNTYIHYNVNILDKLLFIIIACQKKYKKETLCIFFMISGVVYNQKITNKNSIMEYQQYFLINNKKIVYDSLHKKMLLHISSKTKFISRCESRYIDSILYLNYILSQDNLLIPIIK